MGNDEIIDVRDRLIADSARGPLSTEDQNLLRDCDVALELVRCSQRVRDEARERVARSLARGP